MSFFGMGPMELLVIVTVAFIVFGPEKMTEIMGGLGRAVREFRSMTSDLTGEFERTMSEVRETAGDLQALTRDSLTVEGLNPFEQPSSPAAIAAQQAIAAEGGPPTVEPAAVRPSRSTGPAPTKADPLADFAVFGEPAFDSQTAPAPLVAPSPEPDAGQAGPIEATEVLAPVESSNGFESEPGTVVAGLMPAATVGEIGDQSSFSQDSQLGPATVEDRSAPTPSVTAAAEPTAEAETLAPQPEHAANPAAASGDRNKAAQVA